MKHTHITMTFGFHNEEKHFYLLGYLIYWPHIMIPIFKKPVSQQKYL